MNEEHDPEGKSGSIELKSRWNYAYTFRITFKILNYMIFLIALLDISNKQTIFTALCQIIVITIHTTAKTIRFHGNNSTTLVNQALSSLILTTQVPYEVERWNIILFCCSPSFGFFGTLLSSFFMYISLKRSVSRAWWAVFNACLLVILPIIRYKMEQKRKIHLYSWDEYKMCECCTK